MYQSLFGDSQTDRSVDVASPAGEPFSVSHVDASRESTAGDDGRLTEWYHQDVYVSGSPLDAMRRHLASALPAETSRMFTLVDASAAWAPRVLQELSAATDQPLQRVTLRDAGTQRVWATVNRTLIPRRGDATLKVYHANAPAIGERLTDTEDLDEVALALMEVSDMAAFVVGARTSPASFETQVARLVLATQAVTWRCPTLAFVVPPSLDWASRRIAQVDWPNDIAVEIIDDVLASPAQAWNVLLSAWDRHDLALLPKLTVERLEAAEEARAIGRQLRQLMDTAGIMGAAVANAATGLLVAGESHDRGVDLAQAAAALAPAMQAHQQSNQILGNASAVEEVIVSAGSRQFVMRPLPRRADLFLLAQLDRSHSNLTLARLKVAEAQRNLT